MSTLRTAFVAAALALIAWPGASIAADTYPARPVTIIVPAAAGGAVDMVNRVVAEKLSLLYGQRFVTDFRPGAGATIGAAAVAEARPDGYTLGSFTNTLAVAPSLYKNMTFDPVKSFVPIAQFTRSPQVLLVNPALPAATVQDFIALVRSQPGQINYASGGNGTTSHIAVELLKHAAGLDLVHIPYRGTAPALQDVLAGRVPVMFETAATAVPLAKDGSLRALAVSTPGRATALPDVPSLAEAGLKDFDYAVWSALFAPAGTPPEIVRSLNAALVKIAALPDVQKRFADVSSDALASTPEELGKLMQSEVARSAEIVRQAGIKAE